MLRELVKTSSRTSLVESGLLGDARRGRATTPRLLASSISRCDWVLPGSGGARSSGAAP